MDTSSGTAHTTRRDDQRRFADTYLAALAKTRLDIFSKSARSPNRDAVSNLWSMITYVQDCTATFVCSSTASPKVPARYADGLLGVADQLAEPYPGLDDGVWVE
jgi:hypothetical protein